MFGEDFLPVHVSGVFEEDVLPVRVSGVCGEDFLPVHVEGVFGEDVLPVRVSGVCGEDILPVRVLGVCGEDVLPVRVSGVCGEDVLPVRVSGVCGEDVLPVRVSGVCGEDVLPVHVSGACGEDVLPVRVSGVYGKDVLSSQHDRRPVLRHHLSRLQRRPRSPPQPRLHALRRRRPVRPPRLRRGHSHGDGQPPPAYHPALLQGVGRGQGQAGGGDSVRARVLLGAVPGGRHGGGGRPLQLHGQFLLLPPRLLLRLAPSPDRGCVPGLRGGHFLSDDLVRPARPSLPSPPRHSTPARALHALGHVARLHHRRYRLTTRACCGWPPFGLRCFSCLATRQ